MDEKSEDRSAESREKHIRYYRSLTGVITDIREEERGEADPAITEHLEGRILAMEKDRDRIWAMFPDVSEEEWNGDPD